MAEGVGRIAAVRSGKLKEEIVLPEERDLSEAARNLDAIREDMERAVEEKVKSESMKVELVSNVSHDLKTPLTSIISCVDLLKGEALPDSVKEYVEILDRKSQKLKEMVQGVFEISKAASGQLPVKLEKLDFSKLPRQTLADMPEKIEQSDVMVKTEIPQEAVLIEASVPEPFAERADVFPGGLQSLCNADGHGRTGAGGCQKYIQG